MATKVAIIGAGCSGLAAIKCCLEEDLEPTCFEKSDSIGGLWKYSEIVEKGRASIYQSVFTNTSKEMMCYSDFPMPGDFPVYLHHSKILEYLHLYAEHFDLLKYIQFQTEVCSVKQSEDFATRGQWNIEIEMNNKENVKRKVVTFNAVIVCNGHYNDPYLPLNCFPGIEYFKGHYIHSRFYKTSEKYHGKTVLVVGTGNSAGDISVELSQTAKQGRGLLLKPTICLSLERIPCYSGGESRTYSPNHLLTELTGGESLWWVRPDSRRPWELDDFPVHHTTFSQSESTMSYDMVGSDWLKVYLSTRHGSWVVSRISIGGFPVDMAMSRRYTMWIKNLLPNIFAAKISEKIMSRWFDHSNLGLEPKLRLKHPVVNDYLPSQIMQGSIKVKPGITSFSETSVTFEDGTMAEVDEVIFATGYSSKFPFLDENLIKLNDNDVSLYKYVFPIHLEKSTIAFLGLVQPLGPIMPTVELQARWVARVFKGAVFLPSSRKMENYVSNWKDKKNKWFGVGRTQVLQIHYIDYINAISKEIGVHPNMLYLFITDPKLAWQVFFGPCTPYQMRLTGPGKWTGARNAIFTQWNRTFQPTRTRILNKQPEPWTRFNRMVMICIVATALWFGSKAFYMGS